MGRIARPPPDCRRQPGIIFRGTRLSDMGRLNSHPAGIVSWPDLTYASSDGMRKEAETEGRIWWNAPSVGAAGPRSLYHPTDSSYITARKTGNIQGRPLKAPDSTGRTDGQGRHPSALCQEGTTLLSWAPVIMNRTTKDDGVIPD